MGKGWEDAYDSSSELSELEHEKKVPFLPSWGEVKMLLICSIGFFIDAYDLFIINIVVIITNYEYTGKLSGSIPVADAPLRGGLLKAAANIGCVIGQVGFGYFGDYFGRKSVYGKELVVSIIATIMLISVPNYFSARSIFTWLTCWRILLGIGIGGDYPMSSAIVADRSNLRRRGVLLAFIFSFQGWGSFIGAIVAIVLLSIFKQSIFVHGHTGHFDAIWRILIGLVLVPCFGVIYSRFTMTESAKMRGVQAVREDPSLIMKGTVSGLPRNPGEHTHSFDKEAGHADPIAAKAEQVALAEQQKGFSKKAKGHSDFGAYFSEWRHAKILIGTTMTWFLLDIIFYGINLNQGIVVASIGLASSKNPWTYIFDQAKANLIIAAAGFLPGYFFFMAMVEYVGRKPLLIGGFFFNALFFGILAGDFNGLRTKNGSFIAVFTLLQLSFNWGANTATFVIPAEVFPTRVRGTAHGISAACGKVGAIIASLGFAEAQAHIGTANVLWIFFGIAILGIPFCFLIPETKGRDADVVDLQERQAALQQH